MKSAVKVKVSVSLPADLVRKIDHETAARRGGTRSGVMETWLREADRRRAQTRLNDRIEAYYGSRTVAEKAEDEEWAAHSSALLGEVMKNPGRMPPRSAKSRSRR